MNMTNEPTRGERNHNPGNLRWYAADPWQGLADTPQDDGGFCRFVDDLHGVRALAKDLLAKYRRGLATVAAIVAVYAPPSENDTDAYVKAVADSCGVNPGAAIDLENYGLLLTFARAVILHENGRIACDAATIAAAVHDALGE
jgi:hypothetical protein